ncbi:MAG: RES family NAD+ phosphorylase, partial [Gammaproteobacteria bacterium]|nr:RES family NAD+ phosphorylase [Gammaproteobacteria bacterium]
NKTRDYAPYQKLMDVIYNALNPALQTPYAPPPKPHHESFWDELIIGLVAIVVMVIATPAIGAVLFSVAAESLAGLSAVELGVSAAIAGALASAAQQGVAMAMGDQGSFSVGEMLEYGAIAGVTAGMGKEMGVSDLLNIKNPSCAKYLEALTANATINATSQLLSMSMGIQHKFNFGMMMEQSVAAVVSARANYKMAGDNATEVHGADELIKTATGAAFGRVQNVSQLFANYVGDEAGDAAEVLSKQIIKPQPSTSPSEARTQRSVVSAPNPVNFTDSALHTESHFIADSFTENNAAENDPTYNFTEYLDTALPQTLSSMHAASVFALNAQVQNNVAQRNAQDLQRHAARAANNPAGFFHRDINGLVYEGKYDAAMAEGALDAAGDIAFSAAAAVNHPIKSLLALYAAGKTDAKSTLYFSQALMHAQTRPEAMEQLKNEIKNIDAAVQNNWSQITSSNPNMAGNAMGRDFVFGATMFAPMGAARVGFVVDGVKGVGFFDSRVQTVYHTVTSARSAEGVLNGIDPLRFNVESRFGGAFYVSEVPDTTLVELAHHNSIGIDTIRFNFNASEAKILNLTDPKIANQWGYCGGSSYDIAQTIAKTAKKFGFNVIRYSSERGVGENLAVFNNFEKLLSPQMIVPVPRDFQLN